MICENCKIKQATTWFEKEHLCEECFTRKKFGKKRKQGNPTWLDKLVTKKR